MESMIDYSNKLNWLESLAENAAEEMVKYRPIIEDYVRTIKDREHPYLHFSLLSFIPKVESIRSGMFEVAKIEESYSYRILLRSLIEHYCKFMYICMRYGEERTDNIGKAYLIFGSAKEKLDYIKAMKTVSEMLGTTLLRSPIDILKDFQPFLDNMSDAQLQASSLQFTYKNTAKYIHEKTYKSENKQSDLIVSILPLYSELSSFVHGGPSSLSFCKELENSETMYDNIIENLSVSQMMTFHVQAMTFLTYYQKDKKFGDPYNVMTKYLDKMSNEKP